MSNLKKNLNNEKNPEVETDFRVFRLDVVTLFPHIFESVFTDTILSRALDQKLFEVHYHQIRDFAYDKHRSVDDTPYGGGAGMVMKAQPIVEAMEKAVDLGQQQKCQNVRRIYLSPQGKPLQQKNLKEYLKYDQIILLCGRYEGVDERALEIVADEEVSIGDYVLTGGEFAAMVFIDAVVRLIPGVVGSEESLGEESFSKNTLEYPHYTRPPEFRGKKVPEVLLSGDHKKIKDWREKQALERTHKKRPDLLK